MTSLPAPRSDFVDEYLRDILSTMIDLFKISEYEAIGRISKVLGSWDLTDPETENIIGHEEPEYWANFVYYGPDADWWKEPPENLTPRPWP